MLDGIHFSYGLALPAGTDVTYDLEGEWETFQAVVGTEKTAGQQAASEFRVEGDGRLLMVLGPSLSVGSAPADRGEHSWRAGTDPGDPDDRGFPVHCSPDLGRCQSGSLIPYPLPILYVI